MNIADDGWAQSRHKTDDHEVFDVLRIGGNTRAMIERFDTHPTFYANAIDTSDHPNRTVWDDYEAAKAWCEQTTGFARKQ